MIGNGAGTETGAANGANPEPEDELEFRLALLQARAREEEDINRAILLSLRDDVDFGAASERGSGRFNAGADGAVEAEATAALPPPKEEDVANLVAVGFTREQVLEALRRSRNDVEGAANRLLS